MQPAGMQFDDEGSGAPSQKIWTTSFASAWPVTVMLVAGIVPPSKAVPGLPDSGVTLEMEMTDALTFGSAPKSIMVTIKKAKKFLSFILIFPNRHTLAYYNSRCARFVDKRREGGSSGPSGLSEAVR